MAFTIVPFYNVDSTVGGGSGLKTDVMLVQYMLFHVCIMQIPHFGRNLGRFGPTAPAGIGPDAIFPFTGLYTPDLDKWILNFQQHANRKGYGPLTTDGRVNRAPVGWGKNGGGSAGHWYTIQALNLLMYETSEGSYSDLPTLSDVPAELKKELRLVELPDRSR